MRLKVAANECDGADNTDALLNWILIILKRLKVR